MSPWHARASTMRTIVCLAVVLATSLLAVSLHAWEDRSQELEGPVLLYLVLALPGDEPAQLVHGSLQRGSVLPPGLPLEDVEELRFDLLRDERRVAVTVLDDSGRPTHFTTAPIFGLLRGEFHGERAGGDGWTIERFEHELAEDFVVVRVPVSLGFRVVIETPFHSTTFEAADVLRAVGAEHVSGLSVLDFATAAADASSGSTVDNRVDLLIMGDGYRASEQAKFFADAAAIEAQFFSISPFAEYRNYVTVAKLFVASASSGADHPPYDPSCVGDDPSCCADPAAQADPLAGTFVSTALGSRYCAFNIHRLLVADSSAVFSAAAAVPSWDQILLLVNDPTYGGSGGGPVSTLSLHSLAVDVARHEYGHSFAGLADEYDDPFPGFPACSDRFGPACEANVTDETNPSLLKWSPWVEGWVPIPTPEGNVYGDQVGLFEGARYRTTGMYRPRDTECLMHFLGKPFDEICSQEYVLRLYRGGWGEPAAGISAIEPGSQSPTASSFRKCSGAVTLSIDPFGPLVGPAPSVQWAVNGQSIGTGTTALEFSSTAPTSDTVSVSVTDLGPFVHPQMAGSDLTSVHSWSVSTVSLPASLTLEGRQVVSDEVHEACDTIAAGPALSVAGTADLTLHAGRRVVLRSGFRVESGGSLRVVSNPVFPSP